MKTAVKYKKIKPCAFIGGLRYVDWLSSLAQANVLQGQYKE